MRLIRKIIRLILGILLVIAVLAVGHLLAQGYQLYRTVTEETSLEEKMEEVRTKEHYTTLDEMPEIYLQAVIAVEDKRFYSHKGISLLSTARAFFTNLKDKELTEGGSSITQQLAKNLYFTQEKTLLRKVAELFVALDLEREYTKDEILECYLNVIYFGDGYYCVYDASMGYFGVEPADMTDYQSTLLAGIPNAPSVYAPTKNPELAAERQKTVLSSMVEEGYLTQEQADQILEEQ